MYAALAPTEVPVPRVLGVHPFHQAMLSERVVGENWFSRIADPVERVATAQHFVELLAAWHRIDPATLALAGLAGASAVPDLVRRELDEFDDVLARRGGAIEPALRLTLEWLRSNIPDYDGPAVLVQGDTGPGNFMYADGKVVAVVDWELAHLGDPMDDIAWLCLRATQEPFPDLAARLREYEARSGHVIDEARVGYYELMAEAKLQVMSHRRGGGTGSLAAAGDIGTGLVYGTLHRRLWIEALGRALGVDLPPVAVSVAAPTERGRLYDVVLSELRDGVLPHVDEPRARHRTKSVARLVKYLARVDAYGPAFEACELDDVERLLGERPASSSQARVAIAEAANAGRIADRDLVQHLWRRVARDTELLRPAMGVLADRHWPALDGGSDG